MAGELPLVERLVDVADRMLADEVRETVPVTDRRSALAEGLSWRVEVAAQDREYARGFHADAPVAGAGDEDYLDRWLPVSADLSVLAGPRFRALDLDMPFVGVAGSDRVITADDLAVLRRFARERFALFALRYVCLWSGDPIGAWAGASADMRVLAARLGRLRDLVIPSRSRCVH